MLPSGLPNQNQNFYPQATLINLSHLSLHSVVITSPRAVQNLPVILDRKAAQHITATSKFGWILQEKECFSSIMMEMKENRRK